MPTETELPVDGRRARRERSRVAVIDAVFALVGDGEVPPSVEQVAERSGVSVSSIFRMFDGLDDMRSQAFEQFERRYSHLLTLEFDESTDRSTRIDRLVSARVALYDDAGPLMRIARQRALDHAPMAERVQTQRAILAAQVEQCLGVDVRGWTAAEAANLIALVDATTSPEAFEVLRGAHDRTSRQIEQSWRRAVAVLVAGWFDNPIEPQTSTQGATT